MAGGTIVGTVSRLATKFTFYIVWSSYRDDANGRHVVTANTYLSTSNVSYDFDTVAARAHWISCNGSAYSFSKRVDCSPDWPNGNPFWIGGNTWYVAYTGYGTMQINISAYSDCSASTYGADNCNASATVSLDNVPAPPPSAPVTPPATTGSLELGNIYRDGVNARIYNLASGYAALRTFTWYYKLHSSSTWILVPGALTTMASGVTGTTSAWCTQTRGLLLPLTQYDIRCVITFSNGAPNIDVSGTATTTDDKFDIVVSRASDLIILTPQITIPYGSKVSVFKALDVTVRVDLEGNVWKYITTKIWEEVADPLNQLVVNVEDDYTLYDYKVVITDANDVVTHIIFMED